ncbi:Dyp-type peroxidase [Sphaerisporangium aureirubrum]|uniref:Dyp-type peroxidase n=1 Tax=Sphaerisporangium aureirubrum TaxID=1544736 RepID=A0ABW1NG04_9ACTN
MLGPLTNAAVFLVVTVEPGGEGVVRGLLAEVGGLARAIGFRSGSGGLTCVTGIGAEAWGRLFSGPRPAELHPFREVRGARHTAPSTPGDLLFHIRAERMDLCFELATQIMAGLGDAVTVQDEVHGFRYFDRRDLLGFVDGTENPTGRDAFEAVTVGGRDPGQDPEFSGGSYVIVQKYLHDVAAWNALPTEAQELAVGRTKLSDIELPDDRKPADSHVALTTIVGPDGTERKIVRDNMPFGSPGRGEFGTYFIGYSATPSVIEQMLENMFTGLPPAPHDRLLDFSTAVTGTLFHVPTADFLDAPPPPPAATQPAATAPATAEQPTAVARAALGVAADGPPGETGPSSEPSDTLPAPDGSLGIGDLKRSTSR